MMNYLKFWGTRGSCPVSGAEFIHYGGNTSCLEIKYNDAHFIIDAGTGIRELSGSFSKKKTPIHIFLGHPHLDHLIGFPFFEPLYQEDKEIVIWVPAKTPKTGKEIFNEFFSSEFFPVSLDEIKARLEFSPAFEDTPIIMGDLKLEFCQVCHPGITYGFKICTPNMTIGYATDNEFLKGYSGSIDEIPEKLLEKEKKVIDFFKGVDLLIHEAQFSSQEYVGKEGWGHSSLANVAALIKETGVRKWHVVHHDPKHTDTILDRNKKEAEDLLKRKNIACDVEWIKDGHIIQIQ